MRSMSGSRFFSVQAIASNLSFGARVTELNPAELQEPELRKALYDLWIQEGVIVFDGLDGPDVQLELSSIFGRCIMHPAKESNEGAQAGLINVKFDPADGWLVRVDGEPRGQWLPWHSDLIYVDKINHGGLLRPISLPSRLGQTAFADKIAAYELLPDRLKQKIEGLHVRYHYDLDMSRQEFGRRAEVEIIRFSDQAARIIARKDEFPIVLHPMVFTQEETGRKVLNVSPWFATGIKELPGDEGSELLEEIIGYSLEPRVIYEHNWKMNQMVLWDNWRVLHSAAGAPADEIRFLQRTTIDGDYGLGSLEDGSVENPNEYISV